MIVAYLCSYFLSEISIETVSKLHETRAKKQIIVLMKEYISHGKNLLELDVPNTNWQLNVFSNNV